MSPAALITAAILIALVPSTPSAGAEGLLDGLTSHARNNWQHLRQAAEDGRWSLYVSGYAWHAPWRYSSKEREDQNSAALGGGFGRHVYDPAGNYHGLYGLAYLDSNRDPMYMAGYHWQTYWGGPDLKVGAGYTVFVFGRSDYSNYVPLPGVLPVVSLRYSRFELLGAYVPSLPAIGLDRGDVALFLGRINF